ncbi:MAG TPA: hypothetical protein EYM72_03710 [Gammaproteobacteria bacterium]|nr:hypothetical protein [Gammaproteobacteria bacterium]
MQGFAGLQTSVFHLGVDDHKEQNDRPEAAANNIQKRQIKNVELSSPSSHENPHLWTFVVQKIVGLEA